MFLWALLAVHQQLALCLLERYGEKGCHVTVTNCSIQDVSHIFSIQQLDYIPENVHGTVYVSPLKQSLSRANHKGVNNSVTGLHGDRLCGFPMHAEQLTVI